MYWLVIVFVGVLCTYCAYKDYDWFFGSYKARPFIRLFGRDGARKLYMGLGIFLTLVGAVAMAAVI